MQHFTLPHVRKMKDGFRRSWLLLSLVSLLIQMGPLPLLYAQAEPTATEQAQPSNAPDLVQTPTATPAQIEDVADVQPEQLLSIDEQIEAFLQQMTPEDRVGQLFVVAFSGNDLSASSDIATLIHQYRIGGVMLIPANANFTNAKGTDTPREVATLTNQLQALAYGYHLSAETALQLGNMPPVAETLNPDGEDSSGAAVADASAVNTVTTTLAISSTAQLSTAQDLSTTETLSSTQEISPTQSVLEQLELIPLPPTIATDETVVAGQIITEQQTIDAVAPAAAITTTTALTDENQGAVIALDTLAITNTVSNTIAHPVHIPLLIGVEQLGDGYPTTALRRNFTPIPSQLALGSTWNPTLVRNVGAIVGRELNAVGVNLLLGPSLDVTNQPRTDPVGALGVHTFGGDPYWVGKMGSAYIAGLHEGSGFQLAAIARHFPGQGDIDRLPELEVATIQQSLEELKRITLPPFREVTSESSRIITPTGAIGVVDGLLTSHMRFTAFQGTSSTRVPPISLMPDLSIVLNEQGFTPWHENGGILMTNALGVPAIRRYYEAPLQEFPYRRVALDAFVAGHDLIYLAHLSTDDRWEAENESIKDIIQFFRERYNSEPEFQVQVDAAVRRILRLKLGLYRSTTVDATGSTNTSEFMSTALMADTTVMTEAIAYELAPLQNVLVQASDLAIFAANSLHQQQATATMSQVAREALSILYPDLPVFSDLIPEAPLEHEQLLIFSDSRLFYECEQCTAETTVGPEDLKSIILRFYGSDPGASEQILPDNVVGRSFTELKELLDRNDENADLANSQGIAIATPGAGAFTSTVNLTDSVNLLNPLESDGGIDDSTTDAQGNTVGSSATPISSEEVESVFNESVLDAVPNQRLQQLINDADWIIFAMLDVDPENNPSSAVVKRFLRQQSERLNSKKIIVLALNAPYFLDSTEISKLTAYIGVYSKTQPFLDSAVRTLFRTNTPMGSPAVSVPGTRFRSLSERLSPNPSNELALKLLLNGAPIEGSPDNNTAAPVIATGSTVSILVDNILDHNDNPVPDGFPVQFQLSYENPERTIPLEPVLTRNGSASLEVVVEQTGRLIISANAGDAKPAAPIVLRVQDPAADAAANTGATPTVESEEVTPIPTTPVEATPVTDTASITNPGQSGGITPLQSTAIGDDWATLDTLIIAMLTILVTLSFLLILQLHILPRGMLVHNMLWATICGLGAYILFALGLVPGIGFLLNTLRFWSAAVVVFIGMLLPLLWLRLRDE